MKMWCFNLMMWLLLSIYSSLAYADDTTLVAESKEDLKNFLMRVKEESGKAGLKLSIWKTKILASGPITSWQTEEEKMETVTDFIFLDSKITADGNCSHGIKRRLLLGRKAMTNLDSILKSREICSAVKGLSSQSYGFTNVRSTATNLEKSGLLAPGHQFFCRSV